VSGFKRVGLVRMRESEPLLVFSTKWEAASVSNRNTEKEKFCIRPGNGFKSKTKSTRISDK
jgi:hypothetical protein